MHKPHLLRYLILLVAIGFATHAYADDRTEARTHFQAGMKFYASADYRSAIREFSAAQQLAPADLNNYNLALCYDKLGDAQPAIEYYHAYLDKQPNTDKRAEIEASVARLEAAARSAANKRDQAKPAPAAPPAVAVAPPAPAPSAPPPSAPPVAPPPPSADDAAPSAGPVFGPSPDGSPDAAAPDASKPKKKGPAVQGTIDGSGAVSAAPTGDPQLDRINSINVDQIREQRAGSLGGAPGPGGPAVATGPGGDHGPAVAASGTPGQPPAPGQPSPTAPNAANPVSGQPLPGAPDQQPKEEPVYKHWWFWAVVVPITGYVVYELANGSSSNSVAARTTATAPRGLTLLSW